MLTVRQAGLVLMAVFMLASGGWAAGHGMGLAGQDSRDNRNSQDSQVNQESQNSRDSQVNQVNQKNHNSRVAGGGEVRFNMATYNIFYYTPPEHPNSWEQRREHVANVIRFHDIAIWGSQEGEHNQLQDLREMLGHEYVGVARDDGDTLGEHSAIVYDPARFEALYSGTFWLSKTPDRPSMDWGVNFHRICTWGKFRHRESGAEFFIYNVHFDHESQEARENSSRLVLEHIDGENPGGVPGGVPEEMPDWVSGGVPEGMPVVFMGDLNVVPGNPAYEMVLEHGLFRDAKRVSRTPPHGPPGTFNGFDINRTHDRRIDYLFVSDHFEVHRYGVLTDTYLHEGGLRFPSDHFPVVTEVTLRP